MRASAFVVIFFLLLLAVQAALVKGLKEFRTGARGVTNRLMAGQLNAEILLLGSSRTEVHMDPVIIGERLDLECYNLGRSGLPMDVQFPLFEVYLKYNSKPRLVVQGLDIASLLPSTNIYRPGQFVPYLNEPAFYSSLTAIDPFLRYARWAPIVGISKYRTGYEALSGLFHFEPRERLIKGFSPQKLSWKDDFAKFKLQNRSGKQFEVSSLTESVLRRFLVFCKEQRLDVVLVYSPEYFEVDGIVINRPEVIAQMRKVASEFTVPLLDYTKHPLCQEKRYFYNSQHLNSEGARLFSTILADDLKKLRNATEMTDVHLSEPAN